MKNKCTKFRNYRPYTAKSLGTWKMFDNPTDNHTDIEVPLYYKLRFTKLKIGGISESFRSCGNCASRIDRLIRIFIGSANSSSADFNKAAGMLSCPVVLFPSALYQMQYLDWNVFRNFRKVCSIQNFYVIFWQCWKYVYILSVGLVDRRKPLIRAQLSFRKLQDEFRLVEPR